MADAKKKAMNKSQLAGALAESTGLTKVQVNSVLAALDATIKDELGRKGPGVFQLPGMLKFTLTRKPAEKSKEVRNPFTGQMVMSKPKPARNVVRVRPLKAFKDSVA
jgi:nucleoid DNA-binding protein